MHSHMQTQVSSSSSSSSTGTTAHCGLWPIEQAPSIFSYLSPILSIIVKSIQPFPLLDFRNNKFFYCVGLLAPCQTPNLEDQGVPFCLGHHLWSVWHGRPNTVFKIILCTHKMWLSI
jgi:hypothetical protein